MACLLAVGLLATLFVAVPAGSASADVAEHPSLWITDDETAMTYNVSLDGTQLSSFPVPGTRRAESSIAIDPVDRTLWGANDGSSARLVNYDRNGNVIGEEILASEFGGVGTEGLDVTVSADNRTLWVVADGGATIPEGYEPSVYNVSRSGDLISSFPTSTYDAAALSPQAIAYDPFTSSLWITDNDTDKVYNVSLQGALIGSFAVNSSVFEQIAGDGGIKNVQGVGVESSEVIWITARDTSRVYRVKKTGKEVISSFPISAVDSDAKDPTGVAFDRPPGYLGAAASFGMLGLAGSELKMKNADDLTGIVGDVGLGPNAKQDFDEGLLTGTLLVDPSANNSNDNSVVIASGVVSTDLALAASDAAFASFSASILQTTRELGEVKSTLEIAGASGVNVIEVVKIELDDGEQLRLVGDASSTFVFNIAGKFKLKNQSAIVLEGGVSAENVFFNILGTEDSAIESGSFATGTIVAPAAKLKIKGKGSALFGTMVGGREIKLEDGGRLRVLSSILAPGDVGEAAGAAVVALPGSKIKLSDNGSEVLGDVVLGPLAEQDFSEGLIDGTLIVDAAADNDNGNDVNITGGTVISPASQRVADGIDASVLAASLPADQVFTEITDDMTIDGGPGVVVIEAKKIELDKGEELTLIGEASTTFIFNLEEEFKLKGESSVIVEGGLLAERVVFNLLGTKDASIEEGSAGLGTILAPWAGKVKVKESGSNLLGSVISGGEIVIEKGGVLAVAS